MLVLICPFDKSPTTALCPPSLEPLLLQQVLPLFQQVLPPRRATLLERLQRVLFCRSLLPLQLSLLCFKISIRFVVHSIPLDLSSSSSLLSNCNNNVHI